MVDQTRQYSTAEMERMMKLQDVLLKAMAKKITWWDAAEIIGVSDRTMRRWRERIEEDGYDGLADRRKGKPSGRRVALARISHPNDQPGRATGGQVTEKRRDRSPGWVLGGDRQSVVAICRCRFSRHSWLAWPIGLAQFATDAPSWPERL